MNPELQKTIEILFQQCIAQARQQVLHELAGNIADRMSSGHAPQLRTAKDVLGAMSSKRPRRNGVKAKVAPVAAASKVGSDRYRCPVPKCDGKAAPVFGMVCTNHRGVSKAKIKKYRDALRAKKA